MIELNHLSKTFLTADGAVEALRDICLTINNGDIYGIIGMSGAGKSTLVRCINMLERPSEGSVLIDGVDIGRLSKKELLRVRRKVSMIFQGFNLLMQRTCLDNIRFPLELSGVKKTAATERARELLATVGLSEKEKSYPAQLSGGQQQRIAIARALATDPEVLLCDEATSALDPKTTNDILDLICDINKKLGITVIVITHQMSVVEKICNRVAILDGGRVVEEGNVGTVFTTPRSDAARRLVFPDGYSEFIGESEADPVVRVVFNGALAAGTPLIAQMAMELNIPANILFAHTNSIGGKVFGSMVLGIPGGRETLQAAMTYLENTPDISVEEVQSHV